jgi:hypothetical protein
MPHPLEIERRQRQSNEPLGGQLIVIQPSRLYGVRHSARKSSEEGGRRRLALALTPRRCLAHQISHAVATRFCERRPRIRWTACLAIWPNTRFSLGDDS